MIRAESLTKTYDGVPAVAGVDLHVPEGELCVLLGPSGCGKSTLLRLLNAMVPADSGTVRIAGEDIRGAAPERLRRGIGYAVQNVGLFPHYTVGRNIAVVPELLRWPKERVQKRVSFLLDLMGLPKHFAGKYPRELSGGEAQRVGVARALAADPPILLMDEPFGSVDPMGRDRLQRSFAHIHRTLRKTVLFVTHDVSEALLLGDRILLMRAGRIVGAGTPAQMVFRAGDEFSRSFFGSEVALRLLSRHRAGEAFSPGEAGDPGCAVAAEASL
ncbi:MAG TPA: ABC transporter ATP-binding protein, partial [Candidatus Limnocylindria bacterium]|nr:ABC transporter ATP-binding protein [Candidatus Limnocylindria bacterium]